MQPAESLSVAVDGYRAAHRALQASVHAEPWEAWELEADGDRARVVVEIAPGGQVEGFSWEVDTGIWGEPPGSGVRVWITEDTGHAGDRTGGPNYWLVHLRFTERSSISVRAASQRANDSTARLHATLASHAESLEGSISAGSSGDLSWIRLMPPEGTGDGRTWEAMPSGDGCAVVISFTEDLREPDDRIGPAPITGMAWIPVSRQGS